MKFAALTLVSCLMVAGMASSAACPGALYALRPLRAGPPPIQSLPALHARAAAGLAGGEDLRANRSAPQPLMTPNEAATFNRTITRDAWRQAYPGYAPYQYYYVVPSYPW